MSKKAKFIFSSEDLKSDMKLEEIVALISTGDRDSPEYGLTFMILKQLTSNTRSMTKAQMYDLFMRNRDHISKASFYRILTRLQDRGMVIFNEQEEKYQPAILFSNALQRFAIAWESLVIPK